jgi:GR25 family glycosyltransferase involved in LPS biosynthesis
MEWQQFETRRVHQRACWNYWRSLTFGAKTTGREGLVVFEDDVILAQGWERRLRAVIAEVELVHQERYVLALYVAACVGLSKSKNGSHFVEYPVDYFFGTQGMYYPESVRPGFAEFLKAHGVDTFREPYDLLLKDYLKRASIPMFVTIPCLVQHIGRVSTGLAGFHHQARHFHARLDADLAENSEPAPRTNRASSQ